MVATLLGANVVSSSAATCTNEYVAVSCDHALSVRTMGSTDFAVFSTNSQETVGITLVDTNTYELVSGSSASISAQTPHQYTLKMIADPEKFIRGSVYLVGPVRFIQNTNCLIDPAMEALNVSNFVTTNNLPTLEDTAFASTSDDPDNFRLEVEDGAATGGSVTATLQVNDGTPQTYTLSFSTNHVFRGPFLRLVTDAVDDKASGYGPDDDHACQTILVKLGDLVRATHSPAPDIIFTQQLSVGRPSSENYDGDNQLRHDIREVSLNIVVFQNNAGTASVSRAQVTQDIANANARLAQSTIRVKAVNINMGGADDPGVPQPAPLTNGYVVGVLNGDFSHLNPPNDDESALLMYKDAVYETIDVFYVDYFTFPRAMACSYYSAFNKSNVPQRNNWIVINSQHTGHPHLLGHEIMHILLNSGHRTRLNEPDTALFNRIQNTLNVSGPRRIGPYPDATTQQTGTKDTTILRDSAESLP